MANNLGKALEDVSRATGSIAHLYRTLDLGTSGATAKCQPLDYDAVFKALVEETGAVR